MTATQELVESFYAALAARDRETLTKLLHPEIAVTYHAQPGRLPWGGSFTGMAGFDEFLSLVADHVDIVQVERRTMIADDHAVVVPCAGTWRIRATGAEVSGAMWNIFTITEGRITGYEVLADTDAFYTAMAAGQ